MFILKKTGERTRSWVDWDEVSTTQHNGSSEYKLKGIPWWSSGWDSEILTAKGADSFPVRELGSHKPGWCSKKSTPESKLN